MSPVTRRVEPATDSANVERDLAPVPLPWDTSFASREFLTSDVLAQLTEAGILSSSIVKTLTLSTGHSKNVRLRSINRSFVNGHGRRDITTI